MMDERARYRMQRRIAEVIDEETAVTLMAHLPPGGWADVATKGDIARLEDRIDRLDQRLMRSLVIFMATTISAVLATAGVVIAAGGGP
jgi:ubiquinone biosynthesis protein UbiJ